MIYTDIKSLKQTDFDDPERENIARIRIFMWFGLSNETEHIFKDESALKNFEYSSDFINELSLPKQVYYTGKHLNNPQHPSN